MIYLLAGLAVGCVIGAIIGFAVLWPRNRALERRNAELEQLPLTFDSLAQDALRKSSEQFLQLAEGKLKEAQNNTAHDLEKRQKAIANMVDPIGKTLKEMEGKIENLGKTGAGLESQLKTFAEDQRLLRKETQNLISALRNPAARGKWGEMQLQRTLELIGMVEGTHYVQQQIATSDGTRRQPDFIVRMPGGAEVVIDVKTPVEPYWDALESADSEAQQKEALDKFRRHLRDHLKSLSSKEYWRNFDSPEFVVMFLPTEGLYSMAVSNDKRLLEDAARNNIILASPTTIMGLLRVILHGWHQQAMAEEARTIAELGAELYRRISTFGGHMQKVGRNLGTALGAYNDAVGSLEGSVLPAARRMKDHHIQTGGKEIEQMHPLESNARALTSSDWAGDEGPGIPEKDESEGESGGESEPESEPERKKA